MLPVMGNKLKTLRVNKGWTHQEAADAVGISRSGFIKIERGERKLSLEYINRAARVFNVRPADVIEEEIDTTLSEFISLWADMGEDEKLHLLNTAKLFASRSSA